MIFLVLGFLVGVLLASRLEVSPLAFGLFSLANLFLLALLVILKRSIKPVVVVLVLLLGVLRFEVFDDSRVNELAAFHSQVLVQVEGIVVNDPEPAGEFTRLRLRAERVNASNQWNEASGDVLVTLRESMDIVERRNKPFFRYGDRLLLSGALTPPPQLEEFDYPAYLERQEISTVMSFPGVKLVNEGEGAAFYRWLYGVRQQAANSIAQVVPEPQAAVGQALLLGIRDNLPDALVENFRRTGTSHVLAISGLHVGILLGISLSISQWSLGRKRHLYLIAPLVLIWMYALLSGMSPSAVRASIMGTVYLSALLFGRPRNILPALSLAAAIMVAINPNVLWSVSFQLSFAAMAGIAVMAEPIKIWLQDLPVRLDWSKGQDNPSGFVAMISGLIAMTIAATVATLPLVAFYFQQVSLLGLPGSLLVLSVLPLVLVSQALAGLVGLVSAEVALPFGWLAWAVTSYVTGVIDLLARLPFASIEIGQIASLLVVLYYGIFVLVYVAFRTSAIHGVVPIEAQTMQSSLISFLNGRLAWWVVSPVVGVAALVWIDVLWQPDNRLHVSFVDVGQGDAAFIVTPSGQQILVDGGPDPQRFVQFLGEKMPFNDRTIEIVVLTHAHSDHVTGLIEVLNRYDVQRIIEREIEYDSPQYTQWQQAVDNEGAEMISAQSGQVVAFDDGLILQIVNPPERLLRGTDSDVDNASVAFRLAYGNVSFLMTGDMFSEAEKRLVSQGVHLDSDVLKVAHHGSRSSSISEFLDAVSPSVAVLSAGEHNRFGHPHVETLEALDPHVANDRVFLTRDRGTIEFITDGIRLEVETER